MPKFKTTRKQIKDNFSKIFCCGYCDLDEITTKSPLLYNYGIYGWNYDVYVFGNIAVTTGYRGMFGKRIDFEFLRSLQKEAKENQKIMWTDSEKYHAKQTEIEQKLIEWLRTN